MLSSQQLAAAISPQLHSGDLIVVHQEYEFAGTLGFYLHRPSYERQYGRAVAIDPIHILTDPEYNGIANYGRSSNLWYGSFFPDAPAIFETRSRSPQKWPGPQRIFLWQDLANQPSPLPAFPARLRHRKIRRQRDRQQPAEPAMTILRILVCHPRCEGVFPMRFLPGRWP